MGTIYEKAYLTLAATGATNSTVGLLDPECYSDYHLHQVEVPFYNLRHGDDESSGVKPDGVFSVGIEWRHEHWNEALKLGETPLAKRGWITQEWMLSRRTVHFLRGTLLWACRGEFLHENGAILHGDRWDSGLYNSYQYNAQAFTWRELIAGHSARQFTVASDRLISLEGLATELKKARGDEYRYGMWSGTLREELLWIPIGVKQDHSHPHVPSWSWASREGKIKYGIFNLSFEFSLMTKSDVFRGVDEAGVIRVCSRLKLAGSVTFLPADSNRAEFFKQFGIANREATHGIHLLMKENGGEFGWACLDEGNFEESDFEQVFLLLLGTDDGVPKHRDQAWGNGYTSMRKSEYCMLVQRSSDSDIFKRVGIAKVKDDSCFDSEEKQEVKIR